MCERELFMTKIEMKSESVSLHSSVTKHLRLLSVAAVLLICCLAFVGGAEADGNVAKVGDTEYATINEAITAWTTNENTETSLTLLSDVTLSDVIQLTSNKHYTLNLGTFTMKAEKAGSDKIHAINIAPAAGVDSLTLTIDADTENPGGITAGKSCIYYTIQGECNPTIKINGGVYSGGYVLNSADLTEKLNLIITGGTFNAPINGRCNDFQISDGTFNTPIAMTLNVAKLQISGGTFSKPVSTSVSDKLEISGGTFNKGANIIGADADTKLQISGGTFKESVTIQDSGESHISGGTFEKSVTFKGADADSSKLQISDGTFTGGVILDGNGELQISSESSVTVKDNAGNTISCVNITFYTNGGSSINKHTVVSGKTVTKPIDPTKVGYTFEGWYSNDELTTSYDFATPVTNDLNLYANWTANTYTVSFNADGGTSTAETLLVTYDSPYENLPNAEKSGHTFLYWKHDDGSEVTNETVVKTAEDHTLTAVFKKNSAEGDAAPSTSGGSGSEGNYLSYPRTTVNGGLVDFGSSKAVKAVLLPEGSSGSVLLKVDTIEKWPKELETEYTFDISVEKLGEGMAYIHFEIPESSLESLGITPADICAYHLVDDVWVKLITTYEVKDGTVFYEAETDSFSPFKLVIEEGAAEPKAEETEPVIPPTEEPEDKPQEELPPIEPPVQPKEPESPSPILAVLAGLGAAAVLRRK